MASTDKNDAPASEEQKAAAKASITPAVASVEQKEAAADAVEGDGDGSFTSNDAFVNPDIKALVNLPTATDHQGNERIIGVTADNWEHPPSEASADEIAAAEAREKMFEDAKKQRLEGGNAPTLTSDTSGAANASPGVGGSGD